MAYDSNGNWISGTGGYVGDNAQHNGCTSGGCKWDCGGDCAGDCKGTCTTGCYTSCSGGCKGSCTSCDGCSGSCTGTCGLTCLGACNSGCQGTVAEQAFNALINGLQEYITELDINNIYLIFKAIRDRRADANQSTDSFNEELKFTKEIELIDINDIQELKDISSKIKFAIDDDTIIQDNFIEKNAIQKLLNSANTGYQTLFPRGSRG